MITRVPPVATRLIVGRDLAILIVHSVLYSLTVAYYEVT